MTAISFEYSTVRYPQWVNYDFNKIVCLVKFQHKLEEVEYLCHANDKTAHGREIFYRCLSREFGPLSVTSEERLALLVNPVAEENNYVVGDFFSYSDDAILQSYIRRYNLENRSGSETGIVITLGSILDHLLKLLIEGANQNSSTNFAGKITLAYERSIISAEERRQLTFIREIRNKFAHELEISLADDYNKTRCEQLFIEVIGDGSTPPLILQYSGACAELMANLTSRL